MNSVQSLPESAEIQAILQQGQQIADEMQQQVTTAHWLLCLFTVRSHATDLLERHQVTHLSLLDVLDGAPTETPGTLDRVQRRAREVAVVHAADLLGTLHLLVALCSFVDCAAYRLLSSLNIDLSEIRNTAFAVLQSPPEELHVKAESLSPSPEPELTPRRPLRTVPVLPAINPRLAERAREQLATRSKRVEADEPARTTAALPRLTLSSSTLPPSVARLRAQRSAEAVVEAPRTLTAEEVTLSTRHFPLLSRFGRNLTLEAVLGTIDPAVGRDDEIQQLIDILNKRRSNNPLLVGEPGVGKTAIVEGLAHRLVSLNQEGSTTGLENRIIIELEASSLLSGTSLRGAFAERMGQLKQEVARAAGRIIVFLDELHHWMGTGGSSDSGTDAAGDLKTALARSEFPCIGATTWEEYRRFVEADAAFARRFQTIRVSEPGIDQSIIVLQGIREHYAEHHGVRITDDAIEAAVRLTHRYIPDRRLPDKAIGALDLAGSRARRNHERVIDRKLVATVVAEQAGIDPDRLLLADRERYLELPRLLADRIIGQSSAIERVADVLQRNYAGFVSGRPIGSFLFLGPTGVGKTEFVRALADVLFADRDAMVRIDMSEYMEAHSVARLIGAPPGYIGHDAPGQLSEPVRRSPYQIVLLDEIEKAHPDVLNLLIQVLDEGRLTDSQGRLIDFTQSVVIMTSNLGAQELVQSRNQRAVGFARPTDDAQDIARREQAALTSARRHFRPELWNRIDDQIVFQPLEREDVERIARALIAASSRRLGQERAITFACEPEVVEFLIEHGGYIPELGARPMRRTVEKYIEGLVAQEILRGQVSGPCHLVIGLQDGAPRLLRQEGGAADS